MENILTLSALYTYEETKQVIDEFLKRQTDFTYSRFIRFDKECKEFEKLYSMNSEEFLSRFESGELGDDLHWFDWYAVLRGKTIWKKKYEILKGISWKA